MNVPVARGDWRRLRPWRRHSLVVSVAGAVYVLLGLAIALIPNPERNRSLAFPTRLLDLAGLPSGPVLGSIWVLVGLMAVTSARWPTWSETWGYVALASWAAAWAGFYGTSIVIMDAPWKGITGVGIFGLFAFFLWAISGLVNPTELTDLAAAGARAEDVC